MTKVFLQLKDLPKQCMIEIRKIKKWRCVFTMKKVLQAFLIVAVLVISTIAPVAVSKVSAATLSVSDYVIEKNGKLYTVNADMFVEMKAGGVSFLQGIKITHVKSSEGKIYELDTYLDAKGAIEKGTMSQTLQLLNQNDVDVDIKPGQVVVDGNGDISLEDSDGSNEGPVEDDFVVEGIE